MQCFPPPCFSVGHGLIAFTFVNPYVPVVICPHQFVPRFFFFKIQTILELFFCSLTNSSASWEERIPCWPAPCGPWWQWWSRSINWARHMECAQQFFVQNTFDTVEPLASWQSRDNTVEIESRDYQATRFYCIFCVFYSDVRWMFLPRRPVTKLVFFLLWNVQNAGGAESWVSRLFYRRGSDRRRGRTTDPRSLFPRLFVR